MTRKPRDGSEDAPISDVRIALELLTDKGGRWSSARLQRFRTYEPNIIVQYCGRERDPDPEYYRITTDCANALITNQWVQGLRRPGYVDEYEFEISQPGYVQVRSWEAEDSKMALAILLSEGGLPSSIWCRTFRQYGRRYKHWKDERDGLYFVNVTGEGFIVYLDTKEVVRHDEDQFIPQPLTSARFQPADTVFSDYGQGFVFRDDKTGEEKIFYPDSDMIRKG